MLLHCEGTHQRWDWCRDLPQISCRLTPVKQSIMRGGIRAGARLALPSPKPVQTAGQAYISSKDGTGRGCLALASKRLERAGLVRNWTSLDGLKSQRAVVFVSDAGPNQKKMQAILDGTREALGLVLVLRFGLFQGDELCRWIGSPHGYFCILAKLMNFARGTFMAKKILYAW